MLPSSSLHYDRTRIPNSGLKDGAVVTGQTKRIQGGQIMSGNYHLQSHHQHHFLTRWGLAIVSAVALLSTLFASPSYTAAEAKPSTPAPKREKLTISPEEAKKPWTGDLDGMIKRQVIRVLTVYSKTFYGSSPPETEGLLLRYER